MDVQTFIYYLGSLLFGTTIRHKATVCKSPPKLCNADNVLVLSDGSDLHQKIVCASHFLVAMLWSPWIIEQCFCCGPNASKRWISSTPWLPANINTDSDFGYQLLVLEIMACSRFETYLRAEQFPGSCEWRHPHWGTTQKRYVYDDIRWHWFKIGPVVLGSSWYETMASGGAPVTTGFLLCRIP